MIFKSCLQSKSLVFYFTSPVAYWIHLRYVITTSAQPSLESCCHFPCLFQHQLLSSLWFQISRFKTLKSVLTSPMLYPSMWSQSPNYVHFIVHCLFYLFFAFHYLPGPDLKQLLEFCLFSHLTSLFACILAFSSCSSCTHAATLIISLSIDLAPDVPVHAPTHWSGQAKCISFYHTLYLAVYLRTSLSLSPEYFSNPLLPIHANLTNLLRLKSNHSYIKSLLITLTCSVLWHQRPLYVDDLHSDVRYSLAQIFHIIKLYC